MTKLIRVLTATAVLPGAVLAITAFLANAWWDRLPDPLATHWNNGPNGSTALGPFVLVCLILGGVLTIALATFAVIALRRGRPLPRLGAGLGAGFAAMPPAVLLAVLVPNLDAPDWHAATGSGVIVLFMAGVAGLGVVAAFTGGLPGPVPANAETRPSVGLEPGQRAYWSGRAENRTMLWSFALAPLAVAVVPSGSPWLWVAVLVAIAELLTALTYRVTATVDATGVTIRFGVLGFPRRHIALDAIREATARELTTFGDGGLGIRFNPVNGTTAYKVRGGPALVLVLENGRTVLVSVADPETGAGLVNDLIAQRITRIG
jgi:hypothetical protein